MRWGCGERDAVYDQIVYCTAMQNSTVLTIALIALRPYETVKPTTGMAVNPVLLLCQGDPLPARTENKGATASRLLHNPGAD